MSVVAWDGKTLAADMQATNNGLCYPFHKVYQLEDGTILGITGTIGTALIMIRWYKEGADPAKWPATQTKDDYSRLVVVKPDGNLVVYEEFSEPIPLQAPMAWGAGSDFAMGAMAMGADARRAVEITIQLSDSCGIGVEAFDVNPRAKLAVAIQR